MTAGREYLTKTQAATALGVSTRTISRWIEDKKLPTVQIGREHRIPLLAVASARGGVITRPVTIEVSMNYPGSTISKNFLWHGGSRRKGMNGEASQWKSNLAESVRMAFLAQGARSLGLPVTVEVRCRFKNQAKGIDPQNVVELVADAIEEATGINDRGYTITTHPADFDPHREPEILVVVTANATG